MSRKAAFRQLAATVPRGAAWAQSNEAQPWLQEIIFRVNRSSVKEQEQLSIVESALF
jgi:hypothetical protein